MRPNCCPDVETTDGEQAGRELLPEARHFIPSFGARNMRALSRSRRAVLAAKFVGAVAKEQADDPPAASSFVNLNPCVLPLTHYLGAADAPAPSASVAPLLRLCSAPQGNAGSGEAAGGGAVPGVLPFLAAAAGPLWPCPAAHISV